MAFTWLKGTRWAKMSSMVLFPAPDAPMIATISVGLMLKVTGWMSVFVFFSYRKIHTHKKHAEKGGDGGGAQRRRQTQPETNTKTEWRNGWIAFVLGLAVYSGSPYNRYGHFRATTRN